MSALGSALMVLNPRRARGMIRLEAGGVSGTFTLIDEDTGKDILLQSDWDFPGAASSFGWVACKKCRHTDGTVDCAHRTASEMISEAYDFLVEHEGESIPDPGYFSQANPRRKLEVSSYVLRGPSTPDWSGNMADLPVFASGWDMREINRRAAEMGLTWKPVKQELFGGYWVDPRTGATYHPDMRTAGNPSGPKCFVCGQPVNKRKHHSYFHLGGGSTDRPVGRLVYLHPDCDPTGERQDKFMAAWEKKHPERKNPGYESFSPAFRSGEAGIASAWTDTLRQAAVTGKGIKRLTAEARQALVGRGLAGQVADALDVEATALRILPAAHAQMFRLYRVAAALRGQSFRPSAMQGLGRLPEDYRKGNPNGLPYGGPKSIHRYGLGEWSVQPIDPASGSRWDWEVRATVGGRMEIESVAGDRQLADNVGRSLVERLESRLSQQEKDLMYWMLVRRPADRGNPGLGWHRQRYQSLMADFRAARASEPDLARYYRGAAEAEEIDVAEEEMRASGQSLRRNAEAGNPLFGTRGGTNIYIRPTASGRYVLTVIGLGGETYSSKEFPNKREVRREAMKIQRGEKAGPLHRVNPSAVEGAGIPKLPPGEAKSYNLFHGVAVGERRNVKAPRSWPRKLWALGKLVELTYGFDRTWGGRLLGGTVAVDARNNRLYILGSATRNKPGNLGRAGEIQYVVPRRSGRSFAGGRGAYVHPFDSPPAVKSYGGGFYVIAGRGLKVTRQGIVG